MISSNVLLLLEDALCWSIAVGHTGDRH